MKSSVVFKVIDKYVKRQENIHLLYQIRKWDEKMVIGWGWIFPSDRVNLEKERKIGGTARYNKWQDVVASDRKLFELGF